MYLELTGVRKMYDENNGVKQIDLAVEKGMLLTLLGPSGCGKTTLLNLLGGFLKPDAGRTLSDRGSGRSLHGPGAAVYGIPYRVSGNRWRKKLAGQSVRAGREPFPARNEGAAGHAGKTLLRKNIRVCILTDPDIFSILNIPYGGI